MTCKLFLIRHIPCVLVMLLADAQSLSFSEAAEHDRFTCARMHYMYSSLNQRYYSAYLCRQAGVSFVEFQETSPAAKQHPHFQQVL